MNGKSIHVIVVCSFCKAKLFANSNTSIAIFLGIKRHIISLMMWLGFRVGLL